MNNQSIWFDIDDAVLVAGAPARSDLAVLLRARDRCNSEKPLPPPDGGSGQTTLGSLTKLISQWIYVPQDASEGYFLCVPVKLWGEDTAGGGPHDGEPAFSVRFDTLERAGTLAGDFEIFPVSESHVVFAIPINPSWRGQDIEFSVWGQQIGGVGVWAKAAWADDKYCSLQCIRSNLPLLYTQVRSVMYMVLT